MIREKLQDQRVLSSLGVDFAALGPLQTVGVEGDRTDQGGLGLDLLTAMVLTSHCLLPIQIVRPSGADPCHFLVSSRTGSPVTVRGGSVTETGEGAWCRDVRLPEGEAAVVVQPDGRGCIFGHEKGDFVFRAIDPCPGFAEVRSDAHEWVEQYPAIRDLVDDCLAVRGNWAHVKAASLVHRYSIVAMDRQQRESALDQILQGHLPEDPPAEWMASLSDAQLRTIEDRALGEALRASELILEHAESPDPDSPSARADWVEACLARDDLEGLRSLVAAAQGRRERDGLARLREVLDAAIESLDQEGADAWDAVPFPADLRCERLELYATGDRDRWWLAAYRRRP